MENIIFEKIEKTCEKHPNAIMFKVKLDGKESGYLKGCSEEIFTNDFIKKLVAESI